MPNQPVIPGIPQTQGPQSGWMVRNPLSPQSGFPQSGGPVPIAPVQMPTAGLSPQWNQAQNLIRTGQYAQAQQIINAQIQKDGSLNSLMAGMTALERANAPATVLQPLRAQAVDMARTQIQQGVNQPIPYVVLAKAALEDNNDAQFRQATRTLMERHPNSQYAPYFDGLRARKDNDYKGAEEALRKARELGMPEDSIAMFLKIAIDGQKWIWQYAYAIFWIIGLWLAGLVLLFVVGKMLSMLTLGSLEHGDPEVVTSGVARLRRFYRIVINIAGLYSFLSLPILLLLAIALPLTLGYALLMVPFLNLGLVFLVLVLGIGGIITAISGIRAAFVGVEEKDFGRSVTEAKAPELWQLAREVAQKTDTRCVDEIRIILTADVAVIERGGFLRRLRDQGRRVLILGMHALQGLKLDALKCILAHEYGHFRNRDTAGGDIALGVRLAMVNFAEAIERRGKIRWWDVAVHFLRFYHYLFSRLTFGASRLQEVLADRVAVHCYGRTALQEGLTRAIRRAVEFDLAMRRALRDAVQNARPAMAFYGVAALPDLDEREEMETAIRELLERDTDETDSHPSPKDRFALARNVPAADDPLSATPAWYLVGNNNSLLKEMTGLIDEMVDSQASEVHAVQEVLLDHLENVLRRVPVPEGYFERAGIFLSQGDHDSALRELNEALAHYPDDPNVLCHRAMVYQVNRRYHEAATDLTHVMERVDDRDLLNDIKFDLYSTLGHCLLQLGRCSQALEAYDKAIRANPKSLVCLVERPRTAAALQEYDRALQDLSMAIGHWPTSPEPYLERAQIYSVTGRNQEADRDRATAVQLDARLTEAPLAEAVSSY